MPALSTSTPSTHSTTSTLKPQPKIDTRRRTPRTATARIGDVRQWNLRNAGGAIVSRCNVIKTPHGWLPLAAHIWLEHHGSIPEGHEVVHIRIVNPPDDSLANLALSPIGNVTAKIQASSTSSASLRRKKRLRGIDTANSRRGAVNRAIGIRPDWWYPCVLEPYESSSDDHSIKAAERGTIFMEPMRSRVSCWRRYGHAGLSVIKGFDLMTLEEYGGLRREVMEEVE